MKATIISFSGRKDGNCANVAKVINNEYPHEEITNYDFSLFSLVPCGRCNIECFADNSACPYIKDKTFEIYDFIAKSDLSIFIVPNYCDFPCANFFIFNERGLCYFNNRQELLDKYMQAKKKFIVISNTNTENFINVFSYHSSYEPDILFLSPKTYGKNSIDGNIMNNIEAKRAVIDFIDNYK